MNTETIKMMLIAVIALILIYFIMKMISSTMEGIGKQLPGLIKSFLLLGGIVMVIWIYIFPEQAVEVFETIKSEFTITDTDPPSVDDRLIWGE